MQQKVDLRKRNRHIVVVPAKSGVRAAVGSTRGWDSQEEVELQASFCTGLWSRERRVNSNRRNRATLCSLSRLSGNDEKALKRRHEPEDGRNHGSVPDPVGVLRYAHLFAAGNYLECYCSIHQFSHRWGIRLFPA